MFPMKIVALYGRIASGKSTIARVLADNLAATFPSRKVSIFTADSFVHSLYRSSDEVKAELAKLGLCEDGSVDMTALADFFFASNKNRETIENIIHPLVYSEVENQDKNGGVNDILVIDVPILFKDELYKIANAIILVQTEDEIRKARGIKRIAAQRKLSDSDAKKRFIQLDKLSKDDSEIIATFGSYITSTIDNTGDLDEQRLAGEFTRIVGIIS
jgi:dephospho-CoA kinase